MIVHGGGEVRLLKKICAGDTTAPLVVVDGALLEEINVLGGDDLGIKPFSFVNQGIVYCEHRLHANALERVIKAVLDEFFDGGFWHEIKLSALTYPVYYVALCLKGLEAELLNERSMGVIEPLWMLLLDEIDEVDAEESVYLLFLRGRLDCIADSLENVLELVERHHDQELREQTDVLDKEREQQNRLCVVTVLTGARERDDLFEVADTIFDDRYLSELLEFVIETQDLKEMGVRVHVTHLAFSEGEAHCPDLRLGHLRVQISPESLHCHFYLCNGEHRALDDFALRWCDVHLEVVNVARVVEFSMYPVRVANGRDVLS